MFRFAAVAALLAASALVASAQERPETEPCEAKEIATGCHRGTCRRALEPDGRLDLVCTRCGEGPSGPESCVRILPPDHRASVHPLKRGPCPFIGTGQPHPGPVYAEGGALVQYRCRACKATGPTRAELEAADDGENVSSGTRVWSKLGTAPHVGR